MSTLQVLVGVGLTGVLAKSLPNRAAEALYDVVVHRCRRFRPADTLEAADHDLAVIRPR